MKKPCLFFDLDDTILDFHWAEHRALTRAFREAGIEPEQALLDRYSDINRSQWELLERGLLTREQVLVRRFALLFAERGIEADAETISRRYEELLGDGHRFLPGAEELLRSLQGKARLFLASNGCYAVQEARIESSGIAPYFEDMFISELIGADKPSEEFYRRSVARISDYDPSRALMVGDSLTSDILGGIRAGMHTCWLNPLDRPCRDDIVPDAEIRSLSELPELIEHLFSGGDSFDR
ncbi:MAG: YjjG family noncanonical pyrimidine nucleotidase [Oscillospiraceae bacterium]|nr:YjjG family noncanonical pyrimidine nucleotidase [Oscillospiraceae bacterium]MBR3474619.1 YjjG family noncanonical pyrimidine nucleotidase [Oscillospiraceae bacterium]